MSGCVHGSEPPMTPSAARSGRRRRSCTATSSNDATDPPRSPKAAPAPIGRRGLHPHHGASAGSGHGAVPRSVGAVQHMVEHGDQRGDILLTDGGEGADPDLVAAQLAVRLDGDLYVCMTRM